MISTYNNKLSVIMKAKVFYWACNYHFAEKTGYPHDKEIPVDQVFNVAAMIFGMGYNVMLHHSAEDELTIFVDDKRFGQR